jgi:hypothetical protein
MDTFMLDEDRERMEVMIKKMRGEEEGLEEERVKLARNLKQRETYYRRRVMVTLPIEFENEEAARAFMVFMDEEGEQNFDVWWQEIQRQKGNEAIFGKDIKFIYDMNSIKMRAELYDSDEELGCVHIGTHREL